MSCPQVQGETAMEEDTSYEDPQVSHQLPPPRQTAGLVSIPWKRHTNGAIYAVFLASFVHTLGNLSSKSFSTVAYSASSLRRMDSVAAITGEPSSRARSSSAQRYVGYTCEVEKVNGEVNQYSE